MCVVELAKNLVGNRSLRTKVAARVAMKPAVVGALVLCVAAGADDPPRRRRLADGLDLRRLSEAADGGHLAPELRFKLDKAHARVAGGGAASLAADVAARLGCGAAPARVFPPAGAFEREHAAWGLDAWYACAVGGPAASVRTYDALAAFLDGGDHDGVAVVEPGLTVSPAWIPNEPAFMGRQWLVSNAMNLDEAWDEATGSSDVVVQVVDSGTPAGHEDLAANLWTNDEEICENGVDDDGNGFVDDCHGYDFVGASGSVEPSPDYSERDHGAHCAGIVAAVSNNGVGVAGVAGGDGSPGGGARLMTAKVVGAAGAWSGMAAALVYGADMGARISSNSWSYTASRRADIDLWVSGRPDETLNCSSSVTSIRPMFGRIDGSRRVLEAYARIDVGVKIRHPRRCPTRGSRATSTPSTTARPRASSTSSARPTATTRRGSTPRPTPASSR